MCRGWAGGPRGRRRAAAPAAAPAGVWRPDGRRSGSLINAVGGGEAWAGGPLECHRGHLTCIRRGGGPRMRLLSPRSSSGLRMRYRLPRLVRRIPLAGAAPSASPHSSVAPPAPPATRCPSCCDPPPLLTSGRACAQPLRRSSASALCCLLRHLGLGPVKRRGRVRNLRCRALPHGDRAPRIGAARNGSPLVPVVGGWQHLTRLRDLGVGVSAYSGRKRPTRLLGLTAGSQCILVSAS